MPHPRPQRLAWRIPAALLNGLSIGLGLLVGTGLIAALWGLPAAATASSGFGAVSVADNVCAPKAKFSAMWPAVLGSLLVTALVALSRHHPGWQAAMVLLVTFAALWWSAWGKKGLPQSFVLILTLVFQMAAFSQVPMDDTQALRHVGWVAVGALVMMAWSHLTAVWLAHRYRTLALADGIEQLARLISLQARWTRAPLVPMPAADQQRLLLGLIRLQASLADVFQSARDLLYSQTSTHQAPELQAQIDALIHVINLRDVVLACQLDLEPWQGKGQANAALHSLARHLDWQGQRMAELAQSVRQALPWVEPAATPPPLHGLGTDVRLQALARRAAHLQSHRQSLVLALRGHDPGPRPTADQLQTLASPAGWTLAPLRQQLQTTAPVPRYALRATLAMACALSISHHLPWQSHPHWLLMTVAVVMRGNLEQTLARRNARVIGTVAGCAVASVLLWLHPPAGLMFVVLAIAMSVAHGYVQINYRVTAAAGAVLALSQAHLLGHGGQPAWQDAAIRLADTFIGVGLAWGFSYVLPAWERHQLPALLQRLRQAQLNYAHQALRWHEVHPGTPQRHQARREVYDALWLLAQSLQRSGSEPARAGRWLPHLELMLIHSHRLISQLAGARMLLVHRQAELAPEPTQAGLVQTAQHLDLTLGPDDVPALPPNTTPEDADPSSELPHPKDAPTPWLLRRLAQIEAEAQAWRHAFDALLSELPPPRQG